MDDNPKVELTPEQLAYDKAKEEYRTDKTDKNRKALLKAHKALHKND